jgi:hypothetical protein
LTHGDGIENDISTCAASPALGTAAAGRPRLWKEEPGMTGSFLVPIIVPIVAILALAAWLGLVYLAEAHPGWKVPAEAPGPEVAETEFPLATAESGAHQRSVPAPSQRDTKAA